MIGDVGYSEDELIRRRLRKYTPAPTISPLRHLGRPQAPGAWRMYISRESNPGPIDGNDVFYH